MHKKRIAPATHIITCKGGFQRKKQRTDCFKRCKQRSIHVRRERDQELEENIKPKAVVAAKSDLKQNEDEKTTGTTEAETKKEKEMRAAAWPHDQEVDADTAAAKEKSVCTATEKQYRRYNGQ